MLVGRVGEVAGKRWKVDINARQAAVLMLSAVNLPGGIQVSSTDGDRIVCTWMEHESQPLALITRVSLCLSLSRGGIQRRRTHVDELNMRAVFEDGDLISAEVQQIMQDGTVSLHTRQMKYGKLEGGQLVEVPPALIKRQKQHFHHVEELRVDVIFGCNGLVWVGAHVEPPQVRHGRGHTTPRGLVGAQTRSWAHPTIQRIGRTSRDSGGRRAHAAVSRLLPIPLCRVWCISDGCVILMVRCRTRTPPQWPRLPTVSIPSPP